MINVKIEINILKWMLKKLMFLFIWIVIINISYINFLNIEIILYKRFDVMDGLKKVDWLIYKKILYNNASIYFL